MSRLAPDFPWLPADPIDGLVPHRDPAGDDVLFTLNQATVASDRVRAVVVGMTELLRDYGTLSDGAIRRTVARIAALAIPAVIAAARVSA